MRLAILLATVLALSGACKGNHADTHFRGVECFDPDYMRTDRDLYVRYDRYLEFCPTMVVRDPVRDYLFTHRELAHR